MADNAILFDMSKCTGCRGCQVACKQWNGLPGESTFFFDPDPSLAPYTNPPDLSVNTFCRMLFFPYDDITGNWPFLRHGCMHCVGGRNPLDEPQCLFLCKTYKTDAIKRHADGFIYVDLSLCIGCDVCYLGGGAYDGCPFAIPRTGPIAGFAKMRKCHGCAETRQAYPGDPVINGIPACVKTCPPEALKFGDRAALVAEATTRAGAIGGYVYDSTISVPTVDTRVILVTYDDPATYGLP